MLGSGPRIRGDAQFGAPADIGSMATKNEVAIARHLRRNPTPAERIAWELLRDRGCCGVKFKRQHPVAGFVVDFYAPELKLVIEIDGSIHAEPEHAARDELRTSELEAEGLVVCRFRNNEVNAQSLLELVSKHKSAPPLRRVSDGEGAGG